MAQTALALDHVGVCNMELGPMTAAYEALGFSLSPIAQQSGRRTPDSEVELYGSGNRCAFLTHGYIELIAVLDPSRYDNDLRKFTGRYDGIHILAIGIDDPEANLERMRRAGIPIAGVAHLQRPVEAGGPIAKFSRLPYPDAPEGRIQLIQHRTPELVWQPRWMDHANKAEALTEIVVASAEPAETAARLSKLTGIVIEPRPAGGFLLRLPGGARVAGPEAPAIETRVAILGAEDLAATLPGVAIPALPFMAGIYVKTSDGNAAVRRILAGKPVVELPGGALMVPPALAAGTALVFHP